MKLLKAMVCYTNAFDFSTSLSFHYSQRTAFILNMFENWERINEHKKDFNFTQFDVLLTNYSDECFYGVMMCNLHSYDQLKGRTQVYGPVPFPLSVEEQGFVDYNLSLRMKLNGFDPSKYKSKVNDKSWTIIGSHYKVLPIFTQSDNEAKKMNLSYLITPKNKLASMAYISLPNKTYLRSFLNNKPIIEYLYSNTKLIYHSVCEDALRDKDYLNFMQNIKVPHVLDCREINFKPLLRFGSFSFTKSLNRLFPQLYPHLEMPIDSSEKRESMLAELNKRNVNAHIVRIGEIIEFDKDEIRISPTANSNLFSQVKNYLNTIEKLNNDVIVNYKTKKHTVANKFFNEPYIVFLGTGSNAVALKNASGIYVNVRGDNNITCNDRVNALKSYGILLDCGNGTYGQIIDHFQEQDIKPLLRNLKIIYVTHIHYDHNLGLMKILREADKAVHEHIQTTKDKLEDYILYLILPKTYESYMKQSINNQDLIYKSRICTVVAKDLNPDPEFHYYEDISHPVKFFTPEEIERRVNELYKKQKELEDLVKNKLKLKSLYGFETYHCRESQGIVLQGTNWRIVYTGDTAKCETLNNYIDKDTLLIHECTFLGNKKQKEQNITHSGIEDLIRINSTLKPWRTVITHMIRECNPKQVEQLKQYNILIARDHLNFRLADAEWAYESSIIPYNLIKKR